MVADIEELEEMDASELHARRLNAKEVLTPLRSGNFIFSCKPPGENGVREHPPQPGSVRNEEKNKKFFKETQMNYILQHHFKKTQRGMRKLKVTS